MMDIIRLPKEALPSIEELTGDLRIVAEVVGVEKALELGQRFYGVQIRLWNTKKFIRRWRDKQIRKDCDAGMSGVELAKKYNLTDRQVWNILGQADVSASDDRQLGLFG